MIWRKICCAVDFSEPSWIAMEHAAELAGRLGAELTLVHVRVPPRTLPADVLASRAPAAVEAHPPEETIEVWRADAEARAARPVHARVLAGDPPLELARFAAEHEIDLVVVGTHGRSGLSRLLVGSVAERVLRHAPVPVLVVRDHLRIARERDAEETAQYG